MSAETDRTREMYRPALSDEGLNPTRPVIARDEFGDPRELNIAGEYPLTIKVDDAEVVTLMTLGTYPEKLTLGYLRNQRLIDDINEIAEVRVDWDRETVDVVTSHGDGIVDLHEKIAKRTVTSGCGEGGGLECARAKCDVALFPRAWSIWPLGIVCFFFCILVPRRAFGSWLSGSADLSR